ncbi:uncharacterized protein [Antedon mediterranea]|uniref:uncharacterized protein n=1 Tax=Antedon mediterranea TaxID=105859 RepID=UPI003AF4C394
MTEMKANGMDISLVMDSERELRSRIVQMRKLVNISLGLAIVCTVLLCIVIPTLCSIIGSDKARIDHLTRNEEQILKLSTSGDYISSNGSQKKVPESKLTIFTRWGSVDCPGTAELIYNGRTSGAPYGSTGSGGNYLCLTEKPQYNFTVPSHQIERGSIYGTEYRYGDRKFSPLSDNHFHDAPCAVCQAARSVTLMMPAVTKCPNGWTKEYGGYLMAGRDDHKRTEFICVDGNQSVVPGTSKIVSISQASTLFLVEGRCNTEGGGLPCSPYKEAFELPCVVCTR